MAQQSPPEVLPPPQPVTFVLTHLPFDESEDEFDLPEPGLGPPNDFANIATTYLHALKAILSSHVNRAGLLDSVLVNFEETWYQIAPQNYYMDNVSESTFQTMLGELFTFGRILRPGTNVAIWTTVEVLTSIPPDVPIVGCVSGPSSGSSARYYEDYLSAASNDTARVFVIGNFEEGDLATFITEKVTVGSDSLTPTWEATHICLALGRKWGLI